MKTLHYHYATLPWYPEQDLNLRPTPYQGAALPLSYPGIKLVGVEGFAPTHPKELIYSQPPLSNLAALPFETFKILAGPERIELPLASS